MALKLYPPRGPKSPNYIVRGSHFGAKGVYCTTGTSDKVTAKRFLRHIEKQIESGAFQSEDAATFATAAISYVRAGGDRRFLGAINEAIGTTALDKIIQDRVDAVAIELYPFASPATRNRQVYTPISAVLRHAGIVAGIRRPKGARGQARTTYLTDAQAFAFLDAAEALHPRFGALCVFYLYTGCRLSEALRLTWDDVDLSRSYAYIRRTKSGEPRAVFLPEAVVASLANLNSESLGGVESRHAPRSRTSYVAASPDIGTGGGILSLGKNLRGNKRPVAIRDDLGAQVDKLRAPSDCQAGVASGPSDLNAGAAISSRSSDAGAARYEPLIRSGEGDPSVTPDWSRPGARVFRFAKSGALYGLFRETAAKASVPIPPRVAFHILRHSWGHWMRKYGGLDTSGLVATGAWKSPDAARVYEHVDVSEEAKKASLLPTRKSKI